MQPGRADLTEGFERPTHEQWLALTAKSLKGAAFETLVSRTADGLEIQPLYTAQDSPGRIGGRLADTPVEGGWDVRAVIAHGDPAAANTAALEDLAGGAASLIVRLDPAAPDSCAIGSAADIARALEGVVLEAAPVALDAGFLGVEAAGWLSEAAKGSPAALLEFHLDPLGALAEAGRSPGPIAAHVARVAEAAARLAATHPKAALFLANGRAAHEAGGSEAHELGVMAASALAYAKAMTEAGMEMGQAFAAIRIGVSVDGDYFLSIAKLRAARAIWDRMAQACGVAVPARIEARSSRRMLAGLDAWTNLLRLTAAGFAAAAGGAGSVALAPFTDAVGAPTGFARRQARNIQLVLMQESHLGRVRDPAAGSWFVETMSRELAERGWDMFQAIERQGGLVAALTNGFIAANIEGAARAGQDAAAHAHPGQVGVSRFPDLDEKPVATEPARPPHAAISPDPRLAGEDTVCPPLEPLRWSEPFEAIRRRFAALPVRASAAMVRLGAPGGDRAEAARRLLSAAGVAVVPAGETPIVVLTGSDEALTAEGAETIRGIKAAGPTLVLVAAPSAGNDALRQAGADGFVDGATNLVELAQLMLTHLEGAAT